MQQPFSSRALFAYGPDRVYITAGDEFVIDAYAYNGSLANRLSLSRQPRPVLQADVDAYYREYIEPRLQRDPGQAALIRRAWSDIDKGKAHPAIRDILVDRVGYVWLQIGVFFRDEEIYAVMAPDGTDVATISPPEGLKAIAEIGEDYVLGVRQGDFDVLYVVLHDLRRRPD
jgi:hypothetical protein